MRAIDFHLRHGFLDRPGGGESVHVGHGQIEHRDVGLQLANPLHRDAPVWRVRHHFDVLLRAEQRDQALADGLVILGENDSNLPGVSLQRWHASRPVLRR